MVCSSCGQQNRPNARFCDGCGAPLAQGIAPVIKQSVQQSPSPIMQHQQGPSPSNTGPGGVGYQLGTGAYQQQPSSLPIKPLMLSRASTSQGGVVGEAHFIQQRTEQPGNGGRQGYSPASTQILTFRIEQYDRDGNRQRPMSVEMRSTSITGSIYEGDEVEVFGEVEGGVLIATRIYDRTTGGNVEVKKGIPLIALIAIAVVFLGILLIGVLIVSQHLNQSYTNNQFAASPDEVATNYCDFIGSGAYQNAYDQYSVRLQREVTSDQLKQMWSDKNIDTCTHDPMQVSGKMATTTLHAHNFLADTMSNYSVTLIQDDNGNWKIDGIQPK